MINNNNNNTTEEFGALDMLNIMSFMAQMQNMSKDETHNKQLSIIIKYILHQIDLLHEENQQIIDQLKSIEKKL